MNEKRDKSIVWIVNEHGVKSAKYKWLAKQLLDMHPKWQYCDPDPVPEKKRYPMTGGHYTEEGVKRRRAANKSAGLGEDAGETPKTEYLYKDLQKMAKQKGIKSFGKSKAALKEELGLK